MYHLYKQDIRQWTIPNFLELGIEVFLFLFFPLFFLTLLYSLTLNRTANVMTKWMNSEWVSLSCFSKSKTLEQKRMPYILNKLANFGCPIFFYINWIHLPANYKTWFFKKYDNDSALTDPVSYKWLSKKQKT